MKTPLLLIFFVVLVFLLLLTSCAQQGAPQGGPVDTVPPDIVSTYPPNYTTHFNDNKIVLEFDKFVEERTVEESVFISPYVGELEFDWSGKEVEITLSNPLRKNTTYVVNVGTDVVDFYNRIRMAQAFTLAFSTGDDIDHGAIQGRVFTNKETDKPEGVMVFAYTTETLNPDTLDPRTQKPDFITQTGKNGQFSLAHLPFGSYKVFAVRDEYRNLLYDPEVDEFGVPAVDVRLTPDDTLKSGLLMRLSKEDTTKPRLIKAEAKDVFHLLVEFTEPLDTSIAHPFEFLIIDTLSNDPLHAYSIFPNLPALTSFTIVTDKQDSLKGYRFSMTSATDPAGNTINLRANSLSFRGSAKPDSGGLRALSMSMQDTTRGADLMPELKVFFSDAVKRESFVDAVRLEDSSKNNIPTNIRWLTDAAVVIQPQHALTGKAWHRVRLAMRKVQDWDGRVSRDSTKTIRFETLDEDAMSSIEGIVSDKSSADTTGRIYLAATLLSQRESRRYVVQSTNNGLFSFSQVLEGRYVLYAFRDRNGNGKYDSGRPFPYVRSERFTLYPDTLKVRARWPLEGVKVELR